MLAPGKFASFLTALGAPPPSALARGRRFAALPSGPSLGPRALGISHCSPGPHPRLALARRLRASRGPQALFPFIPLSIARFLPSAAPRRALSAPPPPRLSW